MTRPLAVVTGASTGIGFEFAHIAASEGYDLIVAADEALIEAAAADFRTHGTAVTAVQTDLATIEGVDRLFAAAQGRAIDIVIANAGTGLGGAFLDQDVAAWRHIIDTNITGTLYLLQSALVPMTQRQQGRILVTGSIAGYIPGPFNACYNASKAFIDNFTEALRSELEEVEGVTLTTLMPGATETEFFARADMLDTKLAATDAKADPAKVARDGWDAMMAGKGHIVSGLLNKAQVLASGVAPQSTLAAMHRKLAEPGSADPDAAD